MSISALAYASLEEAVNRYLALDPAAKAKIAKLHGKVIAFELLGLGQTLFFIPGPGRLQILSRLEDEPDCRLRGTPLALFRLGDPQGASERIFSGDVEISGDTELAHHFGRILGGLEIDWEKRLAPITGELAAEEIGHVVKGARQWGRHIHNTLGSEFREILQQDLRLLPEDGEVEGFLSAVDRLRDDVERLEARLDRLYNTGSDKKN
jgi:ubiquinone biosynthesis protein UbiJ